MAETPEYLTDAEATEYLRLAPSTLANWRLRGRGPSFYKAGTRVLYAKRDLDTWLACRAVRPGAQPQAVAGSAA